MEASTRYQLTPGLTTRFLGGERVEVSLAGSAVELPLRHYRALVEFAQPRTREEVYHALAAQLEQPEVYRLVMTWEAEGLLQATPPPPAESFLDCFNPGLFTEASVAGIRGQLDGGRAVVIPNAFKPELAERVHQELDQCKQWTLYEDVMPLFHSQHHSLYYERYFPPSVLECKARFNSPDAKTFMQRLTNRDCSGQLDIGASWYMPGDHTLPHRDAGLRHTVAFVWHLAKGWRDDWGGGLYWCPSGTTILPQFNTLTLFNVSPASFHFVTLVSPYAQTKRLALYGWWTQAPEAARPPFQSPRLRTSIVRPSDYGAAPEYIDEATGIIAV